ncbi:MAG: rhodanese-like domain-containing protein [Ahrensia sp.]|nr:rhodanese-like domain-containing protein [Ahrensia sp.]
MNYAGDISPVQCWDMLSVDQGAVLVDVRTQAEWTYVGTPVLPDGALGLGQQWQVFPQMSVDEGFVEALKARLDEAGRGTQTPLCFLCRSGVRSLAAARAMAAHGYENSYNVAGGFEGDVDGEGHRGNVNGWKADGLPWRQG